MNHKELLAQLTEKVLNDQDASALSKLATPNCMFRFRGEEGAPASEVMALVKQLRTAFPDLKIVVEDGLYDNSMVAVRWKASGTMKGPLNGNAATGKTFSAFGINMARIENGKVADCWVKLNRHAFLMELGLPTGIPPP